MWKNVDRWGPAVGVIVCVMAIIGMHWITDQRLARLEGEFASRSAMEVALRLEIQTYQAYVMKLRQDMYEAGIKPSPLPEIGSRAANEDITTQKEKEK